MKWFFTSAVTARALASEHDPALDLSPPVITLDMEGGAVYSSTAYGQQACQTTPDHPMCSGTQHEAARRPGLQQNVPGVV